MHTDKSWFALEITVEAKASEAIEFALNELEALGTEINNLGVKQAESLTVIGYFNELPTEKIIESELNEALRIYNFAPDAVQKTAWRRIGNVDWLFEWKKHWKATETAQFIIAPTWENVENSEKTVVRIEPSMAFGTGTHETTRLCLKAIEENYQSGMSFLDVGTGTGILAVAAAKLNEKAEIRKAKLLAYDTDFDSITIARENAELNEIADKIEFSVGSISENDFAYDFVCANITIDVIIPILHLLIEKSKEILVLSGILSEQQSLIVAELKKYEFENPQIESSGEWISVLIKK
jgi:ribosomal protein L11 methyltransferase